MRIRQVSWVISLAALLLLSVQPGLASDRGKLIVRVSPPQTYIYADGQPIAESKGHYITLSAGEHKIDLYNYGYKSESRKVTIVARKTTVIDVTMQADSGTVSGPWGCITIEGPSRAAVLLNGKDPEVFFVGHVDEFNNEFIWKQELIVPPGKQELTVAAGNRDPWTTTVDVPANQRVVVDAYKGVRKTVPWHRGEQLKELPYFHAGIASSQVAVEKVTGMFSSSTGQINCGDSAHLTWSSKGAKRVVLNDSSVSPSGDQTVEPKQTTDYKFTAAGPGGVYTSDATVNVNTAINASISVSPSEVRYHKVGDKVDQGGTYTVTWSAGNADSVTVDPLGSVSANGSRDLPVNPANAPLGPVDQTTTYTLHASNACGGSETRTATLHISGSVESAEVAVNLLSVYFPTDWPTKSEPGGGLVSSQAERLEANAAAFKQYLALHPDAKLILSGYADERGTGPYNQALSERRVERVKRYLVEEQQIPADHIDTRAYGKDNDLTHQQVVDLASQDPNATPEDRERVRKEIVRYGWAYNRRVDIGLSTGVTSERNYPYSAKDFKVLFSPGKPSPKQVASLR